MVRDLSTGSSAATATASRHPAHPPHGVRVETSPVWTTMWVRLLAAGLGGALTDTAFAPTDLWPAALFGMTLLLCAVRGLGVWRSWLVGFVWAATFFLPHLHFTLVSSGTPIAWIALVAVQSAITACAPALYSLARRAPGLRRTSSRSAAGRAVTAAAVWVLVEQVRAVWPFSGLPWGILAFSQTDGPLVDLAAIGGEVLVSGAVVLAAAFAAEAIAALAQSQGQWPDLMVEVEAPGGEFARPVASSLVLGVGAMCVVAVPAVVAVPRPQPIAELTAVVAQGNVPVAGGNWRDNALGVLRGHADATLDALADHDGRVDVVLWPESATDLDPRTYPEVARTVDGVARATGAPILLGTQEFTPSLENATSRTNDYITWLPGEGAVASYAKQQPVAFGEYMPWRDTLRRITPAVDLVGTDMAAGTEPGLVVVPGAGVAGGDVPVAVGICFEVAYERIIREGVALGGEIIVVPTNNASFGWSREAVQQLAMSRFRAVEFGRTVVQASTMGVSAIITGDGQIVWETDRWERASTVARLPRTTEHTLATRLGEAPLLVAGLVGGGAVVAGAMMIVRDRRRTHTVDTRTAVVPS